ncbi:MAG TPA: hypothetical protein DEP45_15495 [Armatimonadetes bacterium]|nr:hypothetical protein [Armatimonadota bacterium]
MTQIDWFTIVSGVLGGVALLMYGIRIMGEGLESAAGNAFRKILAALTRNAWLGCLVGTVVTGIVQSSTAITVMTVGFVNAQLMTFRQALGIIYGANIGTTVTGQIMAFEIGKAALPAVAVGFTLQYFAKSRRVRSFGQGILGFGLMFLGLVLLKDGVSSLQDSPLAVRAFKELSGNLFLAVVAGAVVTVCIHSSSASLGIAMALAAHNLITLEAAVALMLGDNIGTCLTAQVASIGTQPTARRTAWAHTIHNIVGVALALVLLRWFLPLIVRVSPSVEGLEVGTSAYQAVLQRQVANSHTVFNLLDALLFLIFNSYFAALLERWIPDHRAGAVGTHLDRRLLGTPVAAAGATLQELARMARLCRTLVRGATDAILHPQKVDMAELWAEDEVIDELQDSVTQYLIDLMDSEIPDYVSAQVPAMLHVANDFERVGDHCKNLLEIAEQRRDEDMPWSEGADRDVLAMAGAIDQMLKLAADALNSGNPDPATEVLDLEKKVDRLMEEGRLAHLARSREGECLMLPGLLFLDALMNYEKMGDHVRNVARALAGGMMQAGATPTFDEGAGAAAETT